MNRQILACNVGLDISKADFNACILTTYNDYSRINSGSKVFQNSPSGFTVFFSWCNKTVSFENKSFTMEFTGRYSEKIAHFLYEKKSTVFMVSPFKSNRFRESYDADVKTDQTDAYTLAVMGLERKLVAWQPDSEFFANLKIIVRERYGLIKQKTAIKNKLHALAYAAAAVAPTVERLKEQMKLINKQIREIDKQIENYLKTDEKIWQKVENLQTIPGIGLTTISTILVETDGFRKTANVKELTAFAGYKVTIKESGIYKGRSHISKRGNKFIRQALHMPVLCIIQINPLFKPKYLALKARKPKPIIATTAIERKTLILMYSMYKNDSTFNANYFNNKQHVN